jgi:hypothetical protein
MWYWTEAFSPAIGFAVWVLMRDGLRVSPFDAHPAGDRLLGMRGLDEAAWRSWLGTIVASQTRFDEALSSHDLRTISVDERGELAWLDGGPDPAHCWTGGPELRVILEDLWQEYRPIGEAWAASMTSSKRHDRLSSREERRLWRQLRPVRARLPTLRVYPVEYGRVVAMPIRPASCVVGVGAPDAGGHAFVDRLTEAAQSLAGDALGSEAR